MAVWKVLAQHVLGVGRQMISHEKILSPKLTLTGLLKRYISIFLPPEKGDIDFKSKDLPAALVVI